KSGDAGVRGVESVKDLVVLDLLFPHKHLLGVLAGDGSAAMAVDAAGHVPGFFGYSDQVFSQCIRGHRARLAHVDVPGEVQLIGEVQLDPGQLVVLLLDKAKTEPAAGDEEPEVPVDAETLMVRPFPWPCTLPMRLRANLAD